jgi:hypothetical protein
MIVLRTWPEELFDADGTLVPELATVLNEATRVIGGWLRDVIARAVQLL